MKGKISMNQITLDVKLYSENNNNDVLGFVFKDEESKINLNSESCQAELKVVFSKLVKLSLESNVKLNLVIDDSFNRGLYKDVCKEYIKDLQAELDNAKAKIKPIRDKALRKEIPCSEVL